MEPRPARFYHVPWLLSILWLHTRTNGGEGRNWWTDARLMARVVLQGWVRMITDQRGIAGFIVRDDERVHALYVHPRAQGGGVGRALLNEAKATCAKLELWTLQDNHTARAFYQAQGFTEGVRTNGEGNDEHQPDIQLTWTRKSSA
ncbi:GNAT family N-acetyltransferase [Thalassovita sp.]|jgi:GNAT superfamily N-acetyltransferase|uniref:GNAT family N-acetyltransferase n=1 Tax=Thalassovita sp. TaxID=1979401 RepID=UPI003B5CDFF4